MKEITQKQLNEIIKNHEVWLEDKGDEGSCANLRGYNLNHLCLCGADLRGADLRDSTFKNADLRFSNLQNAKLNGADLRFARRQ